MGDHSAAARILPLLVMLSMAGCATAPPSDTDNLCTVFEENPSWYDYARLSENRWGTPIAIQMAFVNQESSFRHNVRPPRDKLFGFIPLPRRSSAFGYSQAQDPTWDDYKAATGRRGARRHNLRDALDFIGWYNDVSHTRLGLPKTDAERLYLAYHDGHGGYSRGTWRSKPPLQNTARRVSRQADRYAAQLQQCEDTLRCRHFYQIWPFCR